MPMPVLLLTEPPLMVGSLFVLPTPMALPALPPLLMLPRLTAPPLAPAVATPPLPAAAVNCAKSSSLMEKTLPLFPVVPSAASLGPHRCGSDHHCSARALAWPFGPGPAAAARPRP